MKNGLRLDGAPLAKTKRGSRLSGPRVMKNQWLKRGPEARDWQRSSGRRQTCRLASADLLLIVLLVLFFPRRRPRDSQRDSGPRLSAFHPLALAPIINSRLQPQAADDGPPRDATLSRTPLGRARPARLGSARRDTGDLFKSRPRAVCGRKWAPSGSIKRCSRENWK